MSEANANKGLGSDSSPSAPQSWKSFFIDLIQSHLRWLIGGGVIVVVTLIIDSGFKERAAGIQEMQAFDRYVDIILKADNIEERWRLSEYFSTVTPTDRLRERWNAYKDSISTDYINYKELREQELALQEQIAQQQEQKSAISQDSIRAIDRKIRTIQKQRSSYEGRLVSSKGNRPDRNSDEESLD